jgi:sugar-specific transcriptional regulator TrmB
LDLIERLSATGLTRQEAQLYLLLHTEGVMSGYEAAKQSGISRSNAYMGLAGMVGKGAAQLIEGDVQRYAAVPIGEYCSNKLRQYEENLTWLQEHMPAYRTVSEPFMTIKGQRNIYNQMKNLISQAEHRLYLAASNDELAELLPELKQACQRSLKVVILAPESFVLPEATVYHTARQPGQIRLIVDSVQIMTGEIDGAGEPTCLLSKHLALVTLFKEAMVNEIKLIQQGEAEDLPDLAD